jgi:diguanylate cyclase (GGDEF)-like protein
MVVTASVLLVVLVVARVTVLVNRREAAQAALAHRAAHDVLTGLANRTELQARVAAALADAPHGGVTVAYFDLDGFKHVNDRRGHRAGDEVLQIAASRLRAALRPSDVLARMGGDEFVVLYEGPVDVETARRIAGRALHSLDRPVVRQRDLDRISASAGVAVSKAGDDEDTLLAHADAALYEAKRRGGGVVAAFDDGMRSALSRRRRIELELDASLHTSAFQVHYQPVLRLGDGEVAGFEALARWHLSDGTAVPPTEFVGVAEATGLIHELGAVVLERACHDVVVWNATREPGSRLGVSVNVSARQLRRPDFTRLVERTLEQTGVPPSWLMLELTESTLIDDLETAAAQLAHLRTVGVRLAIDDFGTGFSALSALRALPLQVLKVDRSFVSGIGVDPDACAVLASLVDLSHALGLEVLVEGMETTAQLDQVASTGCDLAQGFAIARPMPAAEVGPWLRARSLTAVGASTSAAPAVEGPSEDEREQHRAHERHEHRP